MAKSVFSEALVIVGTGMAAGFFAVRPRATSSMDCRRARFGGAVVVFESRFVMAGGVRGAVGCASHDFLQIGFTLGDTALEVGEAGFVEFFRDVLFDQRITQGGRVIAL